MNALNMHKIFNVRRKNDLFAGVDEHLLFASLTVNITTPVEPAMAPLFDDHSFGVITASTAKYLASINVLRIGIASSATSSHRTGRSVLFAIVWRFFEIDEVLGCWQHMIWVGDLKTTSTVYLHLGSICMFLPEQHSNLSEGSKLLPASH